MRLAPPSPLRSSHSVFYLLEQRSLSILLILLLNYFTFFTLELFYLFYLQGQRRLQEQQLQVREEGGPHLPADGRPRAARQAGQSRHQHHRPGHSN